MWRDWNGCMENKENNKKKLFPLFIDLTRKRIVVAGAGTIAERRICTLLGFAGEIFVIAPYCTEKIRSLAEQKKIVYKCRRFAPGDIDGAAIVLAVTDDEAVNDGIWRECKEAGIPVNVASDRHKCDFHFPGIIEYDGVVIGLNGGGKDHRKVKEVRQKTQQLLKGF